MAPIVTAVARATTKAPTAFETFLNAVKLTGGKAKKLNMPFQVKNRLTGEVSGLGNFKLLESNHLQDRLIFEKVVQTNSGKKVTGKFLYNTKTGEVTRNGVAINTERGNITGWKTNGYNTINGGTVYNHKLDINPEGTSLNASQFLNNGQPIIALDQHQGTVLQNNDFRTLLRYIQSGKNAEEAQNIIKLLG